MNVLPIIPPLAADAQHAAADRQTRLTKPTGALGQLETLSIQLAGMTGRLDWLPLRRAIMVCAGDHGVVAQGISAYPQAVTQQMVLNFLSGGAAINVLARQMRARLMVIDAGVNADFKPRPAPLMPEANPNLNEPVFIQRKIAKGTADFSQGAAMTPQQAQAAIQLGLEISSSEARRGLDILLVGEMGIGNTTSASAIIAALTGKPAAEATGRGTGVDDAALAHKIRVIEAALARHTPADVDTLAKVGGLEIGTMAGLMLGAAAQRVPVVIDGLISTAAALIAQQLAPDVTHYLIAGHRSAEPGHSAALEKLGLTPLLDLGLRLGEGTGAALALPVIEAAMRTLQEMATFDSAGVSSRDVD